MDAKDLSRVQRLFENLTAYKKEIAEIEAMARAIANHPAKISFNLSYETYGNDPAKCDTPSNREDMPEDFGAFMAQLLSRGPLGHMMGGCGPRPNVKKLEIDVNENITLKLLAAVLSAKRGMMELCIAELSKFGLKV